jgi:hypothetical protein
MSVDGCTMKLAVVGLEYFLAILTCWFAIPLL